MSRELYTACLEGAHEACQVYSAQDRCACPCHEAETVTFDDEDDPDLDERNF